MTGAPRVVDEGPAMEKNFDRIRRATGLLPPGEHARRSPLKGGGSMGEQVHVGDVVVFHDQEGKPHEALVTCVHQGDTRSLNLVIVSGDPKRQDDYGRQTERPTSVPHASASGLHGYVWRLPNEPEPKYQAPKET